MWLTIIVFILVLGLLVFVHEFGHFITAKRSGVRVEEFALGFPPKIAGIKKGETTYSVNALPIGGFVRIKGEDGMGTLYKIEEDLENIGDMEKAERHKKLDEMAMLLSEVEEIDMKAFGKKSESEKIIFLKERIKDNLNDPRSFINKPIWDRALILSAGVAMNVVLAMVLFSIGFMIGLPQALDEGGMEGSAEIRDRKIQIVQVMKDTPAEAAEVERGDVILSIDGMAYSQEQPLIEYINSKEGQPVNFKFKRLDEEIQKEITPVLLEDTGKGGIGIGLVQTGIVRFPWYKAVYKGTVMTFSLIKYIVVAFYNMIKDLIISREVAVEVSGPVGIAVITGQVARMGFIYILQFAAMLSLNLAVLNFLPLPALDGGRVLFLLIEAIRRKPVNRKIENALHNAGFALLMLLVVAVTFKDIFRFSDKFVELWHRLAG